MKNRFYLLLLLLLISISSCIKEIDEQIQTNITIGGFTSIRQDAAMDIVLLQDPHYSLEFEGSDIILGDLDFSIIHDDLVISQHGHYNYSGKSILYFYRTRSKFNN